MALSSEETRNRDSEVDVNVLQLFVTTFKQNPRRQCLINRDLFDELVKEIQVANKKD